jgi:hypothetical protein
MHFHGRTLDRGAPVITTRKVRSAALVAVVLACMAGVATRLELTRLDGPHLGFEIRTPNLGTHPFVEAVFEGVEANQVPGLRIRATGCSQPIFIIPLELASIAQPQMADGLYGHPPSYHSTDVFSGKIWQNFGPASRLTSYLGARIFRGQQTGDINVFVRIYTPSDCAIGEETFRQWAQAVLKLGSDGGPSNTDG